jgi:hypothetical protein
MYGIVNKAIQELVIENYGKDTWEKIKITSGVHVDFFLGNETYPDADTYKLAAAVSEELNLSLKEVLIAFGEYWVLKTGQKNYGSLMKSGGHTLKEFLLNLPNFHSRVMLIFPNLTPPEFVVSDIEEKSLHLHYYSNRQGLQDFVHGLIQGLGKMYNAQTNITLLKSRNDGFDHEVFCVEWQ